MKHNKVKDKIKSAEYKKLSGEKGFYAYYTSLFGERWENLQRALQEPSRQIGFMPKNTDSYSNSAGKMPYFLDVGSVAAAYALPVENVSSILDLCAAPGGKTLILSSRMEHNTQLTANERSAQRRARLKRVLDEYTHSSIRENIQVTSHDGSLWAKHETDSYERILLDAPCSSERHVLTSAKHLAQWTSARIRNVSAAQWALLSSAFLVLKPDGYMVYSTCALTPSENDDMIAKLVKKYPHACIESTLKAETAYSIVNELQCNPEKTQYGFHILPDTSNGAGPIYFAVIKKENTREL